MNYEKNNTRNIGRFVDESANKHIILKIVGFLVQCMLSRFRWMTDWMEIEKCSAKSFVCFISLLSIFNALAMAGMDCEC